MSQTWMVALRSGVATAVRVPAERSEVRALSSIHDRLPADGGGTADAGADSAKSAETPVEQP